MKQLFTTPPQLVSSGLGLGLLPEQIPLWADGQEVVFAQASVRSAEPRLRLFEFDSEPLDAAQSFTLARRRLYLSTQDGVYRYIGPQTEYEVPALLATQPAEGSFTQLLAATQSDSLLVPWGDWIISTDGLNPVKLDKNTGSLTTMSGPAFAYARVVWKYYSHLFAADTDLSGRRVYWSAVDDPETWTASLSNDAGSNPLRDLDSRIRAGVSLGPNQAIYSQDQMVLSRYIGGQDVFYFAPALTGIGALNARSVVAHNRFNWGLHRRGIFYTDGTSFDYVDEPIVRDWLRRNVNWDLSARVRGWHKEASQTMCWVVPVSGGYTTIGFDYKNRAFSILAEGARFGREADVFDGCILGFQGEVMIEGAGTTPASWIETKPIHCGDPTVEKKFQMVRFEFEGDPADLTITVAFTNSAMSKVDPFFTETYSGAELQDKEYLHLPEGGITANAMSIKIEAAAGTAWRLGGFQIHGEAAGFVK